MDCSLWKRLDVGLADPKDEKRNHYDNDGSKNRVLSDKDLEASPQEGFAMFCSLEVLDGADYSVVQKDPQRTDLILNQDESKSKSKSNPNNNKKKKKRKRKKAATTPKEEEETEEKNDIPLDEAALAVKNAWMLSTGGVVLLDETCRSLAKLQFWKPTPIQAATLPAALLGRRNVVGAAPTGSGKTLAYLLPILEKQHQQQSRHVLQALVVTPTRELALQVSRECHKLGSTAVVLVGGLAAPKQTRLLQQQQPPIVVGTPGRLWEMISSRQHEHLNDLSQIRFLVIDEADRMIQQGSFPELSRILEAVHEANPLDSDDDEDEEEEDDDNEEGDPDRLLGLPGIPGEARVQMLGDMLERLQQDVKEKKPGVKELGDEEYQDMLQQDGNDDEGNNLELPSAPPVQRQTFVYSATLTLPPSATYSPKKRRLGNKTVDGALAEILEKAHAHGPTKVVDLTQKKAPTTVTTQEVASSSRLPPGLTLYKIACTQKHKDSHLYAYLMTTAQGTSGPCLVFCNSIAAVRRVATTLQTLRLPVRMLHANMQQKARLKAVESLKDSKSRAVVVATDVAARGLDIPSVATVVHYDVARAADTFIHRAGRTARGMGEGAVGSSVSLVSSGEDKAHDRICKTLSEGQTSSKRLFRSVPLDGRLLSEAQERVHLACKIVTSNNAQAKMQKQKQWFREAAQEAGLDVEDEQDDNDNDSSLGGMKRARAQLSFLLSQPMTAQRFGKFLSTNKSVSIPVSNTNASRKESRPSRKRRKRS